MEYFFDHERLDVYRLAIEFVAWAEDVIKRCGACAAKIHLDEASSSIPNNIAEGNGKWSKKDRRRYLEISSGSALECGSCLDTLVAKGRIPRPEIHAGKTMLKRIVDMLTRMILNLSNDDK